VKKVLAILIIPVFLLTATVGVRLNYYSCKAMASISMEKPCCKKVGKGGCCEKHSTILKIKDVFVKVTQSFDLSSSLFVIQTQDLRIKPASLSKEPGHTKGYWDKAPPAPNIGYYILYRSIII
jgi:hypothetical protein